ncbi:MAG: hypothetical protein IJK23_11935 [Clostridia bacterium]|nr:hypothetical protein [Clostridia bacterium]
MKKNTSVRSGLFIAALLVLLFGFLFSGCGRTVGASVEQEQQDTINNANKIVTKPNLSVSIEVNQDGYYSFMGDTEISYKSDGEISWICLHEPSLMSFSISSEWNNGIYLLEGNDGDHLKELIEEACNELRKCGKDSAAKKLHTALSIIDEAGPYTNTST